MTEAEKQAEINRIFNIKPKPDSTVHAWNVALKQWENARIRRETR